MYAWKVFFATNDKLEVYKLGLPHFLEPPFSVLIELKSVLLSVSVENILQAWECKAGVRAQVPYTTGFTNLLWWEMQLSVK